MLYMWKSLGSFKHLYVAVYRFYNYFSHFIFLSEYISMCCNVSILCIVVTPRVFFQKSCFLPEVGMWVFCMKTLVFSKFHLSNILTVVSTAICKKLLITY